MQLSLSQSWRGTQQRSIIKGVRSKESCHTCWTLWFSVFPDSVTFSPRSPRNIEGNDVPGTILGEMQPGRIKYKLLSVILEAPQDRTRIFHHCPPTPLARSPRLSAIPLGLIYTSVVLLLGGPYPSFLMDKSLLMSQEFAQMAPLL